MLTISAIRLIRYTMPFHPPISFLGRLINGPWWIRDYDRVLLPSLISIVPLIAILFQGYVWPAQLVWTAPLACFVSCSITLGMPPTLRHWALTGAHRIASPSANRTESLEI